MELTKNKERRFGGRSPLLMGAIALASTVLSSMDTAYPAEAKDKVSIVGTLLDGDPTVEHSLISQNLFGDNANAGNVLLLMPNTHMQHPKPNESTQSTHMNISPNLGGNVNMH